MPRTVRDLLRTMTPTPVLEQKRAAQRVVKRYRAHLDYYRRCVQGLDAYCPVEISLQRALLGSNDGEWCISTSELPSEPTVLSLGVGMDISFDRDIARLHNARVEMFDPTSISRGWIASQSLPENITFHPVGIATYNGEATFDLPVNHGISFSMKHAVPTKQSEVCTVRTWEKVIQDLGLTQIDVLKMDIEGAEYDVLPDVLEHDRRPRQLLVEFHHRLVGEDGVTLTRDAIAAIRDAGYRCFYRSPRALEFCFILTG